jgi:glucosylceramidase
MLSLLRVMKRRDSCLGLTVQNEPMAKQTWESCIYTTEEERDFVKKSLRLTLKNAGLGDKTVWDHNRDLLSQRASTILDDRKPVNMFGELDFIGMKVGWRRSMFENVGKVRNVS